MFNYDRAIKLTLSLYSMCIVHLDMAQTNCPSVREIQRSHVSSCPSDERPFTWELYTYVISSFCNTTTTRAPPMLINRKTMSEPYINVSCIACLTIGVNYQMMFKLFTIKQSTGQSVMQSVCLSVHVRHSISQSVNQSVSRYCIWTNIFYVIT